MKNSIAENIPNGRQRLASGRGKSAADLIGIDDGCAKIGKHAGYGGLAAGNAAGESNGKH